MNSQDELIRNLVAKEREKFAPLPPQDHSHEIRTDVLTREEFDRNCMHYADWALYTPPEQFLFHYYSDSPESPLWCHRPMVGMEKYVVNDMAGRFYGVYDTRDITFYLKTKTWIELPSEIFFAENDFAKAKRALKEQEDKLKEVYAKYGTPEQDQIFSKEA